MNKIIDCLTKDQVELYKTHIDYLIDNNLVGRTPEGSTFANTCEMFSDPPMELLLHYLQPKVEEAYGKELVPTYSFWRCYFKHQCCPPHKDRNSCEVSLTLNIGGRGGDDWAFYAEDDKYILNVGQALLYKGMEQEHWRHELPYERHYQVFLHWIEKNGQYYPRYQFDERPSLYVQMGD
jgi:hypothetical protein